MERADQSVNINEHLPSIFLSHSRRQKLGFVTHLYHALRDVRHLPFFDKDSTHSLPPGIEYPPRIFQACQACKIGVVVLSEGYLTTLWPMLELQHLISHHRRIYPLFYELQPADLTYPENLSRWKKCWKENEERWQQRMSNLQKFMSSNGWEIEIGLAINSWEKNLEKLQYLSGEVRYRIHLHNGQIPYQSEYDYIQVIVSNICDLLPPLPRKYLCDDANIKGGERMAQEIADSFNQQESLGADGVTTIGVYGIRGSGKTQLCGLAVSDPQGGIAPLITLHATQGWRPSSSFYLRGYIFSR
ncbi:hypothetical protein GOP47_0010323 [Adiantum capillus-veneris]|uniref:TIR domain-containing protein n=1 Tax=Adiantum capillus-veneris TaxID=13818 RepID=A0A9D4ZHN5_ADICA|nr:hypothetical protein GOP47_0010323 [Adiantum capillus-veneris]